MSDAARNARFNNAMSLYRPDMKPAELYALRRAAGTLRPVSRLLGNRETALSRFLWWFFDVEYVR